MRVVSKEVSWRGAPTGTAKAAGRGCCQRAVTEHRGYRYHTVCNTGAVCNPPMNRHALSCGRCGGGDSQRRLGQLRWLEATVAVLAHLAIASCVGCSRHRCDVRPLRGRALPTGFSACFVAARAGGAAVGPLTCLRCGECRPWRRLLPGRGPLSAAMVLAADRSMHAADGIPSS